MNRNKKIKRIATAGLVMGLCLTNTLPAFTSTGYIDSIGSVDMIDDGATVGFDETQNQKTEYYKDNESIKEDGKNATNVYATIASKFDVTISKTIILSGNKNDNENFGIGRYIVKVNGDIAGNESINVVPDETVDLYSKNKDGVIGSIEQDKTKWIHSEVETDANGTITAKEITAGSWNGTFNFNINLDKSDASDGQKNLEAKMMK